MYMHHWGGGWDSGGYGGPFLMSLLAIVAPFLIIFILWSLFWKGLALWHAAKRGQYCWFMILLVVNTLGILEIIYLFLVAKIRWNELFSNREHHRGQ